MAKVYKFSGDPNKVEAGSNFIDYASINSLPAIEKVKCITVDTEWTSKDGNEGWHIVVELVKRAPKDKKGRAQQYSQLHRYIMLDSEWVEQRIAELCDAFLGNRPKQVNAVKFVGKTAAVKLRGEVYEGEERAKIQRFLELDEAEDDEDDEPEDEEEDDDAEEEDEGEAGEEDDDEDEEEDYNEWSLAQLRAELKRRELDSKGKKDDLVERLEMHDQEDEDEDEDEDEAEDEEEDDYSEYSTQELKDEAKRRGLRVLKRHTDEDLIAMLEEDDENEEDPLDEDEE